MAFKSSIELHHHFPKLAEESGFAFNVHRPRIRTDWNKFRAIDIDNLIRERRFAIIEQHIADILNCVLESEFDVRILDEGILKLFKLAQLTVEYQQFCRQYLDRSVYVMREELNSILQELGVTKKDLKEKEEELKRLRKRSKHAYRPSLPYGNENIATMILKTLSNKGDIFPSTSNEGLHYNKCSYCDKVFLNQLYLKSHMARRHTNVTELAQKDTDDNTYTVPNDIEKSQLHEELAGLKNKLQDMESLIAALQTRQTQDKANKENKSEERRIDDKEKDDHVLTKDAEVATNSEDYFIEKIEEWKKQEHQKYNSEISLLKTQIIETITSLKDKETNSSHSDHILIQDLTDTIKRQGEEILALQRELKNYKIISEAEDNERKQEMQAQLEAWANRTAAQSKQYEILLQKLNEVATEAQESRAVAKAEKERAEQLRALLLKNKRNHKAEQSKPADKGDFSEVGEKTIKNKVTKNSVTINKNLENLHRKAQELLSIRSSTSTDSSTESEKVERSTKAKGNRNKVVNKKTSFHNIDDNIRVTALHDRKRINSKTSKSISHDDITKIAASKEQSGTKKVKSHNDIHTVTNTPKLKSGASGSPVKIVRAKITEEVNIRLVSAGVDPLKSRIPRSVFQKQRMQLQQLHDMKTKKNASYQKVKNSILAYLDLYTTDMNKERPDPDPYTLTNKMPKHFSFSNVLSNVKSKALSLVKTNEASAKSKRIFTNEKSKRDLLKTPTGSAGSSPVAEIKTIPNPSRRTSHDKLTKLKPHVSGIRTNTKEQPPRKNIVVNSNNTDTDDHSSDSNQKYYNSNVVSKSKYTIDHLIKSPARRPSSAIPSLNLDKLNNLTNEKDDYVTRKPNTNIDVENNAKLTASHYKIEHTSDDMESIESPLKKAASEDNLLNVPKQTKGVLKNASSTSSLNKKKVLFDMEAIQMKSVSASPSQSITDKSDGNEKLELGLVNLDTEDWDISSIENEPLKIDTRIQNNIRSPKVAELKQTIEFQLARRNETPSTALVGGVDVLTGTMRKTSSIAGSNTSLGSSILDESESGSPVHKRAFVKPINIINTKDDSDDVDLSEYSVDGIVNKNKSIESF